MNNVMQVVEVTPTPNGQMVTFWLASESLRVSGEFKTKAYITAFDRGDVFILLTLSDESLSIVGPHSFDLLTEAEMAKLPLVPDKQNYKRHDVYSRFELDRRTGVLSATILSKTFMSTLVQKDPEDALKALAAFH